MNTNIIKSGGSAYLKIHNVYSTDDADKYQRRGEDNEVETKIYPFMRWQFDEIFTFFDKIALRIRRISEPQNVEIILLPFDDHLKIFLIDDLSDDYYVIISKQEFEDGTDELGATMFILIIALNEDNEYYFYLQGGDFLKSDGGGEESASNGIRIPNPPPPPKPGS